MLNLYRSYPFRAAAVLLRYNRDTQPRPSWPDHLLPLLVPPLMPVKDDIRGSLSHVGYSPSFPLIFTLSVANAAFLQSYLHTPRYNGDAPVEVWKFSVNPAEQALTSGDDRETRNARRAKRRNEYEINSIPRKVQPAATPCIYTRSLKSPFAYPSSFPPPCFRTFLPLFLFFPWAVFARCGHAISQNCKQYNSP